MHTKRVSPYGRPNDKFGYAVYSVVVIADPEQRAKVQQIRDAVGNQRSMIPAHITVKGTFCEIEDLDHISLLVDEVAKETSPVPINFGKPFKGSGDHESYLLAIQMTRELFDLHARLFDRLAPITTSAYGPETRTHYRPHLTIYAEPLPEMSEKGEALAENLDLGAGFTAHSMHLMGHVGPPYRGEWRIVQEYPFVGRAE